LILELILAIIGASYIWTIIHHINISKMKETIDSLNLARARIDENVHKLSLHIANVIEKDAKTGAEIVHKVLENGEKELVQVKNAAYLEWEILKHTFEGVKAGTIKGVVNICKKCGNEAFTDYSELKGIMELKPLEDKAKSWSDDINQSLRDLDKDTEAVKRGVVKELSEADTEIIENIAKEENKV